MDSVGEPWLEPEADVSNAMVVVAAPTIGFVGPITAQFLVRELAMDRVGGLVPTTVPPVARVGEGSPSLPVAIHTRETACGPEGRCERLVVVETEMMLDIDSQHALAQTLVDWCQEQGAHAVIAPDGFFVHDEEGSDLRGAASSPSAVEHLRGYDVEVMEAGYIVGLSGGLLCYGEMADVEVYCLLAESNPTYPDARAASRIVGVLDRFIPEIDIETEPLLAEAEHIEEHVRREAQRLHDQASEAPYEEGMMFG